MILGIQIIGILFSLFMIYLTFLHQKRKEFNITECFFWTSSWSVFMIIAIYPKILAPFVNGLELSRTMDLLTIFGFLFVIGVLFYTYLSLKKTNKKIEISESLDSQELGKYCLLSMSQTLQPFALLK